MEDRKGTPMTRGNFLRKARRNKVARATMKVE